MNTDKKNNVTGALPPLSLNFAHGDTKTLPYFAAFASAMGVKRMAIGAPALKKAGEDKEFAAAIVKAGKDHKIDFFDAHAPHGLGDSLGNPLPGGIEHAAEVMMTSLRTAAELGVKVVTMHTSRTRLVEQFAPESGPVTDLDLPGAIDRTMRQLELLIPEAEKLGIVIALENLFLPSSSASHLMKIISKAKHANLGLCYDSGHALIVEKVPGKTPEMIAQWIACGWENDTVDFQENQLDIMLPEIVTTHFHDNDGREDLHLLPGDGIADWKRIHDRMLKAPRLISIQSEVMASHITRDINASFKRFAETGFAL